MVVKALGQAGAKGKASSVCMGGGSCKQLGTVFYGLLCANLEILELNTWSWEPVCQPVLQLLLILDLV